MQIWGEWYHCSDEVQRPVLKAEVRGTDGSWVERLFLVDTGADRTVFDAALLTHLRVQAASSGERLSGLGGDAESVSVETEMRIRDEAGAAVLFRGRFAGVTDPEALDISILGRDITDLFTVVVDRSGDRVVLVRPPHSCLLTRV
jgi:hypothetical protein